MATHCHRSSSSPANKTIAELHLRHREQPAQRHVRLPPTTVDEPVMRAGNRRAALLPSQPTVQCHRTDQTAADDRRTLARYSALRVHRRLPIAAGTARTTSARYNRYTYTDVVHEALKLIIRPPSNVATGASGRFLLQETRLLTRKYFIQPVRCVFASKTSIDSCGNRLGMAWEPNAEWLVSPSQDFRAFRNPDRWSCH